MDRLFPELVVHLDTALLILLDELLNSGLNIGNDLIISRVEVQLRRRELGLPKRVLALSIGASSLGDEKEGLRNGFPHGLGDHGTDGMEALCDVVREDGSRSGVEDDAYDLLSEHVELFLLVLETVKQEPVDAGTDGKGVDENGAVGGLGLDKGADLLRLGLAGRREDGGLQIVEDAVNLVAQVLIESGILGQMLLLSAHPGQ